MLVTRRFVFPSLTRKTSCENCSHFDEYNPYLVQVDECTKYHDVIIKCHAGFYLNGGKACKVCTNCTLEGKYQGQACTANQDAKCCEDQTMIVKDGKCQFAPIFCGRGEYLVPSEKEKCLPCEPGSTNPELRHRLTECTERPKQPTDTAPQAATATSYLVGLALVLYYLLSLE
ncbi:hypothetical protein ElyMa_004422100 [Elysia marginata]|uniref:TNFR-Cys domain-containing protein n=1 Tax=Elysia marginata TaxID=1093978 RepID=A0AAV4HCK8_9GAST|nr:hypothetical protein ElyMa_004422100 [Elysia marginata]